MKSKKYLIIFILFFSFAGCAKDKSDIYDDKIIARIGIDYEITLNDLKQYVMDWNYNKRFPDKSEAYRNALNALITNQLKRFDFFDRKLNENQNLMKEILPTINFALINAYFEKEFVKKYVDEKKAAEVYKQMDKEVIINDILLPFPEDSSKENIDSLTTIALKIESGLNNSYDINELIKTFSLKNTVVNRKSIAWLQSMNDPVANIAFKLQKGNIQAIRSFDGIHIIEVLDIKKIKLEPFDEIKDEIISDLQKGYYQVYNNEFDIYRYRLVDKNSIKWNQVALEHLVKWSEDDQFYAGAYKDTIQNTILKGNNFEILSYDKGKVDLKEYLRLLEEVIILSPNTVINSANVKEFILEAVYDDNVIKAAENLGLDKEIINPYTQDIIVKDRIVYLYNKVVIEGSIPEATPEELKRFYKDQKDSIFYQLKKINLYTRIYSDSTKAAEEINEINKGTPFEKISHRWFVKTYIRERDGLLKSYKSQEPPYLAEAGFKLGLNEVAGPVEFYDTEVGKQFAVIKCIKIQPEKHLTYDDVKGKRITEEFTNYYRQKISDEIDAKLREKYDVEIFEDTLSEAIAAK